MNLLPQSPLFESTSSRLSRVSALLEQQRKWSSFLAASLLGVPLGMLPWLISSAVSRSAGPGLPGTSGIDALLLMLPVPLVAIAFIVAANLHSDRIFRAVHDRLRARLRSSDLAMHVLEESILSEHRQMLRPLPLPNGLALVGTSSQLDKLEFFAHYFQQIDNRDSSGRRAYMAIRQEMWGNLIFCIICSAGCFLLIGFLLLPFAYRRIFISWPRVSAARVSFAEFISQRNIS